MKAPFPWFGGKSRAANLIWSRFGNVPNYVEPFAGSLAVLLERPHPPGTETVNDADCFLANFWRAIAHDPDATAKWADWPVNECDLLARHRWLAAQTDFQERMRRDPDYHDPKIAGWWAWGLCQWIGSGWCRQRRDGDQREQIPHLGNAGMGINRKLPHLSDAGRGEMIRIYFRGLADRLRDVRVACGDWTRVMGEAITSKRGLTGILLDPPYSTKKHTVQYAGGSGVAADVREWALANGDNPLLRIALCGYEGEHEMPGWSEVAWKAHGGYGLQSNGRGRSNAWAETIWFSPYCLPEGLFDFSTKEIGA